MDVLDCKVCFQTFDSVNRKPRSFTCGHTYCSVCLNDMLQKKLSSCPSCRKDHKASTLDAIPVNYSILELIEAVESSAVDLSALAVLKEPVRPPKETAGVCDDHGNQLVFFCTTCDLWICRDCTVIEHQQTDHNIISIKTMLSQKKEKNKRDLESIEKQFKQQMGAFLEYSHELHTERDTLLKLSKQIKKTMVLVLQEQNQVKQTLSKGEQLQLQLSSIKSYHGDAASFEEVNSAVMRTSSFKQRHEQWICGSNKRLMEDNKRNNLLKWVMMMVTASDVKDGECGRRVIYVVHEVEGNTLAAPITLLHGRLHLHTLTSRQPPEDVITLPYGRMRDLVNMSSPLTFLQLTWDGSNSHVYIRVSGHTQRGQNFFLLCTGERGHSYSSSHFLVTRYLNRCGEYVEGGDYEKDNGTGGAPLLDGLEYKGEMTQPITCGVVSARSNATEIASIFRIYTKDSPGYIDDGVFGQVETGMDVLREAVKQKKIKNVQVSDCGVVIPF